MKKRFKKSVGVLASIAIGMSVIPLIPTHASAQEDIRYSGEFLDQVIAEKSLFDESAGVCVMSAERGDSRTGYSLITQDANEESKQQYAWGLHITNQSKRTAIASYISDSSTNVQLKSKESFDEPFFDVGEWPQNNDQKVNFKPQEKARFEKGLRTTWNFSADNIMTPESLRIANSEAGLYYAVGTVKHGGDSRFSPQCWG